MDVIVVGAGSERYVYIHCALYEITCCHCHVLDLHEYNIVIRCLFVLISIVVLIVNICLFSVFFFNMLRY